MPHYLIYSTDKPNTLEQRLRVRDQHLTRLKELDKQGRLVCAGPMSLADGEPTDVGFAGSAVIAEFSSLTEAQAWADADPYVAAGVYQQTTITRWKLVFGN